MRVSLNREQAKGLSNFFLDIAKGLVLATLGFTVLPSGAALIFRAINVIALGMIAYYCVRIGLRLLENK
ncbi:MAG: hypothetical protein AAB656_01710 [Patescibacteria group bacterium]